MKDSYDIFAYLLAAEDHPHLREDEAYRQAEAAIQASPELQKSFEESKAFFHKHSVLTRIEGLPAESRERLERILREEFSGKPEGKVVTLSPWSIRKNFAWAAMLALLLAGMSVLSSSFIQQHDRREKRLAAERNFAPDEAFYQFAGQLAEGRMPLQHRENGSTQLVSWLENQGAPSFEAPSSLMEKDTMGCAYLDGPNGKVTLICFNTESGTVHLFVTSTATINLQGVSGPKKAMINQRQALKWHDEENAYMLIAHDQDQDLPEVFL